MRSLIKSLVSWLRPKQSPRLVVNVVDPTIVGAYLSTEEGERLVLNVLRRNGRA